MQDIENSFYEVLNMMSDSDKCKEWEAYKPEAHIKAIYREVQALNNAHHRALRVQKPFTDLNITPEIKKSLQELSGLCLLLLSKLDEA